MPEISSGMAFVFDSLAVLLLFAVCVGAWLLAARARVACRVNIRFAAMLFAALAAARALGILRPEFSALAPAVAMIAASLGTTALALALFAFLARPLPPLAASLALGLALGAGLAAALSGAPAYALVCQIVSVSLTMAAGLGAFAGGLFRPALALLAAVSLLCGGFVLMDGAINLALLFFAAGLIGAARASQPGIETPCERHRLAGVKATG
jgi:hypothetical protein